MPGLVSYSLGTLANALQAEFGWSRPAIQAALLFSSGGGALGGPVAGYLVERFGVRAVASASAVLLAASVAACGLAGGSLP